MQISSGPTSWQTPRSLAKPGLPPPADSHLAPLPDPDDQGDDPTKIETAARWVGKGAQGLAMAPQFFHAHPWVLETARLKGLTPVLEGGAALFGGIGVLSLGFSGTKDVVDGIRHKNVAEVLIGASDLARGAYVGGFAYSLTFNHEMMGRGFGFASGALQTAGGVARMLHKKTPGNAVSPRVLGAIEVGQGLAWAASMVGVPVSVCFAVRMGLGAARAIYTHHEQWSDKKGKS
jgi:hypothetical protein